MTSDERRGLRHNANWRRLWVGQAVSIVGDFVFNTTVVLWVATVIAAPEDPWGPAAVAGVLIAAAAPILLVGPIAGVFVDRWDRRRTLIVTDLIRAGLVALLLIVPLAGASWPVWLQLSLVYAVVALTSATSQFFNPARFAVIATTVAKDDQARAFGLLQASASTAAVIGPPLAAPLLFGTGVQWALLINVASYLVSFVAVRAIRMPEATAAPAAGGKAGFWPEFKEGLRFFAGSRSLIVIVGAVWLYMFGVGALNVLDVYFVTDNLHVDAVWLGTLSAGLGIGSILGAVIASRVAKLTGEVRAFALGLAATGLLVLIYSRLSWLPAALVVLALVGIPLSIVNVVVGPLVLRATPQHLLGRVNAVLNPLIYLASILSMAVAGFLASTALRDLHVVVAGVTFTRIDTIFGISAVLMATAGFVAWPLLAKAPPAAQPDAGEVGKAPVPEPAKVAS